jgi:hypothetical protein
LAVLYDETEPAASDETVQLCVRRELHGLQEQVPNSELHTKSSYFGYILEGLGMDNDGVFILHTSGHLVYFMDMWYILWLFAIFVFVWYTV